MPLFKHTRTVLRVVLLGVALTALAACSNVAGPNADAGPITAQASGKFSGGSIFSGSVNGIFEAVGLGNVSKEPYLVEMTVQGLVWYACINKGGNEAPGQLAFTLGDEGEPLPVDGEDAGSNGKYETGTLTVDITDPAQLSCTRNKNWRVKTWADTGIPEADWPAGTAAGDAVTYLEPASVIAKLIEVSTSIEADRLTWTCNAPDPTYPLEEYDFASIAPLSDVCTIN